MLTLLLTLLWMRPDPAMTPGAINPDISFRNQAQTICAPNGWTTRVIRPPARYTTALKIRQLAARGADVTNPLPRDRAGRMNIRACVPRSA